MSDSPPWHRFCFNRKEKETFGEGKGEGGALHLPHLSPFPSLSSSSKIHRISLLTSHSNRTRISCFPSRLRKSSCLDFLTHPHFLSSSASSSPPCIRSRVQETMAKVSSDVKRWQQLRSSRDTAGEHFTQLTNQIRVRPSSHAPIPHPSNISAKQLSISPILLFFPIHPLFFFFFFPRIFCFGSGKSQSRIQ